jgi:uncharacterized protein (DUF362 family)/NAD-dependent dihydropyrimidine dehydrogenase PreA subunit
MPSDVVLRSGFDSYSRERILEALREMIPAAGGWPAEAVPGARVLLKVNMLSAKAPERAITTHPEIVAAVALLLRERGCTVLVGDSPGGAAKGVERYWRNCGYMAVAEELGIELVNFESSGSSKRTINTREYDIAQPVLEADCVISLCKFKTHAYTRLTNAVKNAFGIIPGFGKALQHSYALRPSELSERIVDIWELSGFRLTIMDALLTMEGKGPSTDGTPRWDGILGVARNGAELDMVMTRLAGLRPLDLHTNRIALERGLCRAPEDIPVQGLEGCSLPGFRVPGVMLYNLLPPIAGTLVRLLFKRPPKATADCNGCGTCAAGCPVGAIEIIKGMARMDRRKCILCLCCHEICPRQAVKIHVPFNRH